MQIVIWKLLIFRLSHGTKNIVFLSRLLIFGFLYFPPSEKNYSKVKTWYPEKERLLSIFFLKFVYKNTDGQLENLHVSLNEHCVKSFRIRSYSDPYFRAFGMFTERHGVSLGIQSECRKIKTRTIPNTDTFHAVEALC